MDRRFDVVVVGSGTAGATAAKACAGAGRSVALVERGTPGGTCALRGCQPKKYFVVQAELARHAEALSGRGVGGKPSLDWPSALDFKKEFTGAVPGRTRRGLADAGIELLEGTASFDGPGVLRVDDHVVRAGAFVLATGARPRRLDVPGGGLARTSDDFLAQETLPDSLVLVGGGYISFEFAHVAAAFGSRVTLLHRSRRVLRTFDADLADGAVEAARAAGIDVVLDHEPSGIAADGEGLVVTCGNGARFGGAAVFACIGREPQLADLNLEALGIEPGPDGLAVDVRMRVEGRPDLYAIGDCARSPALSPVADREAAVAAANLTGRNLSMDYRIVPSVCFCRPPLARVGLTGEEARGRGLECEVREGGTVSWPNLRRLGARHGRYKVVVDPRGGILGAHLLTEMAGDLINLFALAMSARVTLDGLGEIMWAYPTLTSDVKYLT